MARNSQRVTHWPKKVRSLRLGRPFKQSPFLNTNNPFDFYSERMEAEAAKGFPKYRIFCQEGGCKKKPFNTKKGLAAHMKKWHSSVVKEQSRPIGKVKKQSIENRYSAKHKKKGPGRPLKQYRYFKGYPGPGRGHPEERKALESAVKVIKGLAQEDQNEVEMAKAPSDKDS